MLLLLLGFLHGWDLPRSVGLGDFHEKTKANNVNLPNPALLGTRRHLALSNPKPRKVSGLPA